MSGLVGRKVVVRRGGTLVAGARAKSISINGSPIDVTSDDEDGVRKLLDQPGQVDVEISISGIARGDGLRSESLSTSDRVQSTEFIFQGFQGSPADTHGFVGDFFLASYSESAPYNDAVTFEATFQSAGTVTYTAG